MRMNVKKIIESTSMILAKIEYMCMQALWFIKQQQYEYSNLLRLCRKKLLLNEITEIERHLTICLTIDIPTINFKEIQKFYSCDFLNENEMISEISHMEKFDATSFLEEDYGMFIQGHTSQVTSVTISSDNKHILSASWDTTIRIWNLQDKRQEAILVALEDIPYS